MRRRLVLAAPAILLSRPGWAQNTPSDDLPGGSGITVPQGLVGYWPLNEGGGAIAFDRSGRGNNGTLVNTPTWGVGQIKGALSFNGSTQYVQSIANIGISGDAAVTASAWINPTNVSGEHAVCSFGSAGGSGTGFLLDTGSNGAGSVSVEYFGSNGMRTASGRIATGSWWHLVATKTPGAANTTTTLYVNGVSQSFSVTTTVTPNMTNSQVNIGRYVNAGVTNVPFAGAIDDARIYNHVLSAAEVMQLYLAGQQGRP